jgi:hypothetical protein
VYPRKSPSERHELPSFLGVEIGGHVNELGFIGELEASAGEAGEVARLLINDDVHEGLLKQEGRRRALRDERSLEAHESSHRKLRESRARAHVTLALPHQKAPKHPS